MKPFCSCISRHTFQGVYILVLEPRNFQIIAIIVVDFGVPIFLLFNVNLLFNYWEILILRQTCPYRPAPYKHVSVEEKGRKVLIA